MQVRRIKGVFFFIYIKQYVKTNNNINLHWYKDANGWVITNAEVRTKHMQIIMKMRVNKSMNKSRGIKKKKKGEKRPFI